jgi:hypothetical protein
MPVEALKTLKSLKSLALFVSRWGEKVSDSSDSSDSSGGTMTRTIRGIFADIKAELKLAMMPDAWMMYIRPLAPVSFEQGLLTLETPDAFVQQVCEVRLDRVIRRELAAHSGRPIETRYVVIKEIAGDA